MRAAQTDRAFEKLYADNYAFVWHALRRLGVPSLTLDDAVQETFVTAFRRRDSFDGRSPRAWLYCIGRRVANNAHRSRTRRERRHAEAPAPTAVQSPSEGQVEARQTLNRFLETLAPQDRELFVLSEIDGLTGPELVAALGRKLPTLYGRVRVLRQRLREFAGDDFDPRATERAAPALPRSAGWLALQPWVQVGVQVAPASTGFLSSIWGAAAASPWLSGAVAATAVCGATLLGWNEMRRAEAPPATASHDYTDLRAVDPAPAGATRPGSSAEPPPPEMRSAAPTAAPTLPPKTASDTLRRSARMRDSATATKAPRPSASLNPPRALAPARDGTSERPSPLAEETRQLRAIQALLRSSKPTRALELLTELDQRFPRSVQADLRAVLRVEALCDLGRDRAADQTANALRSTTPGSPMMPRLERTCAARAPSLATDDSLEPNRAASRPPR